MCVSFTWQPKTSSQAEVCNFDLSFIFINQQVAWLQVSVHDSSLVAVKQSLEHLPDDRFDMVDFKCCSLLVKIFLHVHVEVLKNEVKFVFSVDNVQQADNTSVV